MMRITTLKTALGSPKLVGKVLLGLLLCLKNLSLLNKLKWWQIDHNPLLHLALKYSWLGQFPSMSLLKQKNIHLKLGKSWRSPPVLLHPVLVLSTSKYLALRRLSDLLQTVYSGTLLTTLMLMLPNTTASLRT